MRPELPSLLSLSPSGDLTADGISVPILLEEDLIEINKTSNDYNLSYSSSKNCKMSTPNASKAPKDSSTSEKMDTDERPPEY